VAEAGRGGAGPCIEGPEGNVCYGASGAVTHVRDGKQQRIAEGLPSLAGEDGSAATGPQGIASLGYGTLYVTIGLGNNPAVRSTLGDAGKHLG
jgi:hypothetical protein